MNDTITNLFNKHFFLTKLGIEPDKFDESMLDTDFMLEPVVIMDAEPKVNIRHISVVPGERRRNRIGYFGSRYAYKFQKYNSTIACNTDEETMEMLVFDLIHRLNGELLKVVERKGQLKHCSWAEFKDMPRVNISTHGPIVSLYTILAISYHKPSN